jgi:hypothetical protein
MYSINSVVFTRILTLRMVPVTSELFEVSTLCKDWVTLSSWNSPCVDVQLVWDFLPSHFHVQECM